MKGPARKLIPALEVEFYINGLMARWSEIHGKAALQLLKIAELFTKSEMSGSAQKLKEAATKLDAWCAVHFADTADWQRLKTYVRVQRHKARRGDLFSTRKVQEQSAADRSTRKAQAQSAADRLAEAAWGGSEEGFE